MKRPEVGEEIHYTSRRGGYLFLAHVVRVADVVGFQGKSTGTAVIARNLAGSLVTIDLADLYVDKNGRWVEGVRYA
jgi:hypothetical protein